MAGRPRTKPRVDIGRKRENYTIKHDSTGKTFKENAALKSFWSKHRMEEIIQLSTKELELAIDTWIAEFQAVQLKRDPFWWYPTIHYDPTPKVKKEKKVNTSFNTSFVRKKMIE